MISMCQKGCDRLRNYSIYPVQRAGIPIYDTFSLRGLSCFRYIRPNHATIHMKCNVLRRMMVFLWDRGGCLR